LTLEAVARGRPKKVLVHFAAPPPEVVKQPDGSLRTSAEAEAQTMAHEENEYEPTTPAQTPRQEPESSGGEEAKEPSVPSGGDQQEQPMLELPTGTKRSGENEILMSPTKKQAFPSPTGMKRGPEIPAEALDPRVTDTGGEGDDGPEGGVLQVFTHVDEAAPELPEESYIHLGEDDLPASGPTGHPDTWTDEQWISESLKGKAKELSRLKHYGVYVAIPWSQAKGKYVTTRWEEVPKFKNGEWIIRSRFVAREFKWQQPHRDDIFGVTSSSNTSRVLDLLLAKNPGYCAYLADVECAFFHASEDELCFVEAPQEWLEEKWEEDGEKTDWVWQLAKQLYADKRHHDALVTTLYISSSTEWDIDVALRFLTFTTMRRKVWR